MRGFFQPPAQVPEHPSRRWQALRAAVWLILVCVVGLCAACRNAPLDPNPPAFTPVERPAWVDQGSHPDYPASQFVFVFLSAAGDTPPSEVALRELAYRSLHGLALVRLQDTTLPRVLAEAAQRGRWAHGLHLPASATLHVETWTDGFDAASFLAFSRADLIAHNQGLVAGGLRFPKRLEERPAPPDDVLEALDLRLHRFAQVSDDIIAQVLAQLDGTGPMPELSADALALAAQACSEVLAFPDELIARLEGGNLRYHLGERPSRPIELELRYRGKAATGLPLLPLVGALSMTASRAVDASGLARLSFDGPIRFTHTSANPVGFAIDPDALLPGIQSGLRLRPWTTTVTLPALENVAVVLALVEKDRGTKIEGPVTIALGQMLKEAGMVVLAATPPAEDERFVLTIEGVLRTYELERLVGTRMRQMRAEGSIVLRTPRQSLASTVFSGVADVPDGDLSAGSQRALADGWALARASLVNDMREVFPPLFLPLAEASK